jgi:hypothetical protein
MSEKPAANDAFIDAISGHNRVIILCGVVLGIITAYASYRGWITPQSAIPAFGWIVFGMLICEMAYGFYKKAPPATLISMPGRLLALVAGVGLDMLIRQIIAVN